ncbi:hypothetical protein [Flavobacterium sp. FlaQc-50]|uniref:hypothetical protein n=1 Tax=unclassified Flavobacterium TaxID=196869 RepID=UPI00375690C9
MTKLKKGSENKFLSLVCSKFFSFAFITTLILTILYSCSSGDESITKSGTNQTTTQSSKNKKTDKSLRVLPIHVEQNLNSFSQQIFLSVESMEVALNKNTYVGFNTEAMQMLNAAQTENDLRIVFEKAGIANSQEVINILKKNIAIQQAFIIENPMFFNLTLEEQVQFLNSSITSAEDNYDSKVIIPSYGVVAGPNCGGAFNTSIRRCAGDFGTCAVFAVAGAYAGLAPGLLAAAYCMVTKISCDSRAKEDYKACAFTRSHPDEPKPPTGKITTNCDKDSCWTTDSNGKYIERTN